MCNKLQILPKITNFNYQMLYQSQGALNYKYYLKSTN